MSRVAAWAGGAAILFIAFIVTADTITRKFFTIGMQNVPEISGYAFIVAVTWSFSYTALQRGHIRIDTLYGFFPRRVAAVANLLSAAALFGVAFVLTYYAWNVFQESWSGGSRSVSTLNAPLWVPQFFWATGLIFFSLVMFFILAYAVVALARGDLATVNRVAGLPTIAEAIQDEMQVSKD